MKTRLFISIVIVWGLIGCTRNQEIDIPDANLSLFARTESPADTKTVVEEGVHVFWEPGDEIAVFMGEKSAKFTTDLTAASGTATFKGTFGDESWPEDLNLWAVYPYSEEATFDGETITTVLPSEQVAREGSFGKDMNLSIAHSTSASLQFYNVGGGIRFSVTEEGIKKVMFEGLSGEIISGKVKIGFDGNGIPVVKEVSCGSQFITLLPPTEKETFEPGMWYYIVAIPGALEGGYKLRFYKDSDYARKVSEKAVEIKRSIYGNVEKADEGIEYEATTTHFPKTKEEIVQSVRISLAISEYTLSIVKQLEREERTSLDILAEELGKNENVLNVYVNSIGSGIIIQQKDSVFFNFYPIPYEDPIDMPLPSPSCSPMDMISHRNSLSSSNSKKKALLLYPAENIDYHDPSFKKNVYASLDYANLDYADSVFENETAEITLFLGDYLDNYDFIHIFAHGGVGGKTRMQNGQYGKDKEVFHFATGTQFSEQTAERLLGEGKLSWDQVVYATYVDGTKRFCMTPEFLNEASFKNSCVITTSCGSSEEISGYSYMLHKFLSVGAAVYSGYSNTISTKVGCFIDDRIIRFLCHGLSFQDSAEYWKNNPSTIAFSTSNATYFRQWYSQEGRSFALNRWFGSMEKRMNMCDYHLYTYEMNSSYSDEPYFLVDSHEIVLDDPVPTTDGSISFSWECGLEPFSITDSFNQYYGDVWETYIPYEKTHEYTIHYEVFIDDTKIDDSDDSDKKALCQLSTGNYTWYVVVRIKEDNTVIASYQSDMGYFTVKEPEPETLEPIDLGLSVKWASFNLGATKPEEYGDYFAWGETATKDEYTWETYQWYDGDENHLTKYNATDQATLLNMDDDVVQQKLKGMWRVPSVGEWQELMEQCTWNWTTRDGVAGYDVTSNLNGKFIFIPAAGYKIGNSIADSSIFGRYWLGTCYIEYMPDSAASGLIKSDIISWISSPRYMGLPIRPVMPIPVESVSLDKTSLQIPIGSKATLTAIILPENATVKDVIWSSSNPSIATVGSITGEITGIAAGSTVITATPVDGHFSAQCPVQVVVPVTGITLDKNTMTISEGETQALMATVLPDNAYNKEVVWSSSNQAVATVTGDGKVTGVSAGSAVITATTSDGNKKATCRITVIKPIPINEIILSKNTLSMIVGESFTLTATILPSNATETDLSWKVDDSSVATVTDGKVTALKKGVTKVRAFHSYSSGLIVEGVCDVTVKDKSGSHEGTEEEGWQ